VPSDSADLHIYLYRVRESLGWSLREAADRAGISFSRLGEIERGRDSHSGKPFVPSYVTLCRLAAAYGLPPAELLRRAGHQPGPELTADEWALLDAFRRLGPERRQALLASLEAEAAKPA
jgi:transcriptional regulator with XRE-family HTH domain